MNTNTTTAEAMLSAIIDRLGLGRNTIVFHILDGAIASGSVLDTDGIELSDAFLCIANERDSAPEIAVDNVTTYMLGTGETYDATETDIEFLKGLRDAAPGIFADMLYEYADILVSLDSEIVPNPYYFEEEE